MKVKIYIAVLEQDCDAHYFLDPENAKKYLITNVDKNRFPNCTLDPSSSNENGELWNDDTGESIGYFYSVTNED